MSDTAHTSIRIVEMPDLGAVTDASSFVGENAGSGRFSATAVRAYLGSSYLSTTGGTITGDLGVSGAIATTTLAVAGDARIGGSLVTGISAIPPSMDSGDQMLSTFMGADYVGINVYGKDPGDVYGYLTSSAGGGVWLGSASGVQLQVAPAGTYGATATFNGYFDFAADGSLTLRNSLQVPATDNSIICSAPGGYMSLAGGTTMLQINTGGLVLNGGARSLAAEMYSGSARVLFVGGGGELTITGSFAAKPGGGAWADSSDARIKNVTGDYTHGLAEILQLNPKTYTFRGNEMADVSLPLGVDPADRLRASPHYQAARDATEFIGLIAQDVEAVLPEMVTDIPGTIDGMPVTDLKLMDTTALIYALVNSVKTLEGRLAALEAAP